MKGYDSMTLDDAIYETLIEDYPRALREWGKRTEADIDLYQHPARAKIYADAVMKPTFGAGHGQGLCAAWSDYAPAHPPRQRTRLQERMRAKIAMAVTPTFKTNQAERGDAYARIRIDLLEPYIIWNATVEAVRADLNVHMSDEERRAREDEERYITGRRQW
jgi:hypothetical protein